MWAAARTPVAHWASLPNFYSVFQVRSLQGFLLLREAVHKQIPCSAPLCWLAHTPSENTSAFLTKSVDSGHRLPPRHNQHHAVMVGPPDNVFSLSSCHCLISGLATHLHFSRYTPAASQLSRSPEVPPLVFCPIHTHTHTHPILMLLHLWASDS